MFIGLLLPEPRRRGACWSRSGISFLVLPRRGSAGRFALPCRARRRSARGLPLHLHELGVHARRCVIELRQQSQAMLIEPHGADGHPAQHPHADEIASQQERNRHWNPPRAHTGRHSISPKTLLSFGHGRGLNRRRVSSCSTTSHTGTATATTYERACSRSIACPPSSTA